MYKHNFGMVAPIPETFIVLMKLWGYETETIAKGGNHM